MYTLSISLVSLDATNGPSTEMKAPTACFSASAKTSRGQSLPQKETPMTRDFREILFDLVQELSTELDLHYEDDEFFALRATIEKLQEAALALNEAGLEPPASYAHVVARFHRQNN